MQVQIIRQDIEVYEIDEQEWGRFVDYCKNHTPEYIKAKYGNPIDESYVVKITKVEGVSNE